MSNISDAARARQEAARETNGRFGVQPHDRADSISLGAAPGHDAWQGPENPPESAQHLDPESLPWRVDMPEHTQADIWNDGENTHIEYRVYPDYAYMVGTPIDPDGASYLAHAEPDDADLYFRHKPVMDRVIEERHPDARLSSEVFPWVRFRATLPGEHSEQEMLDALGQQEHGPQQFARTVVPFDETNLFDAYTREADRSALPVPAESAQPVQIGAEVRDETAAATAAFAAREDRPELARLADSRPVRVDELNAELARIEDAEGPGAVYAREQLGAWAARSQAEWAQARKRREEIALEYAE